MVFDYYFSRSKPNQQPHFYNYYLDQQPDWENGQYKIVIQLPNLGNELAVSSKNDFFTLNSSSESNELVVSSDIWNFQTTETFRDNVMKDYVDFLSKPEDPKEKPGPKNRSLDSIGLKPSAIQLVKTRIAEVIPMTFEELLFYHYGFNSAEGYVDLQQGMRLRVDYQNYQLVHPAQDQRLHGYTGSGTSYYQVAAKGASLSFDPFIAGIQNTVVETSAAVGSSANGVAGSLDLQKLGVAQPYVRLFYPDTYSSISSAGWLGTERNVTLIGTNTLANLDTATEEYIKRGAVSGNNEQVIYFRGRAAVIPEISIFVNDQPEYVALGTTVRQLLDRYLSIPSAMNGQDLGNVGLGEFQRVLHQGPEGKATYRTVHFEHYQAYTGGMDVHDIPLIKGDRIRVS